MAGTLYDDGVYSVTAAIVSTPRRFYPVANTTASIRRDPLWAAIMLAVLGGLCLAVYGDLLHLHEQVVLIALCASGLALGRAFTILRISALGHSGAMIVGRSARIHALYLAIRDARTVDLSPTEVLP